MPHLVYALVNTRVDLLKTNIAFFMGRMAQTFYYGDRWGIGSDQNSHAESSGSALMQLTHYDIFTFNGQDGACPDEETKQRSYVDFVVWDDTLRQSLFDVLVERKDVMFMCQKPTYSNLEVDDQGQCVVTIDDGKPYTVIRSQKQLQSDKWPQMLIGDPPPKVQELLDQSCFFGVVVRDWCSKQTADGVVLDIIVNTLRREPVIPLDWWKSRE